MRWERCDVAWESTEEQIVVARVSDGEILLIPAKGIIIWDHIEGATTDELVSRVAQHAELASAAVRDGVADFLADLEANQVIRRR